jgi:RNA polymerase sigma-70 factor (ECF subfamily)
MADPSPIQALVERCRAGDQDAARELVQLYADRLAALARQRLSQRMGRRIDPEDVVQSVFRTFFSRSRDGQFQVQEPADLWRLLARITVHKTFRQIAHHKAAKRDVSLETSQGNAAQDHLLSLLDHGPTPEEAHQFGDQVEHFQKQLGDTEQRVLELRLQGYKDVEIAQKLKISDRTIRRLMERVRALAEQEGLALE